DVIAIFFLQHCKLTLGLFFDDDDTGLPAIEAGLSLLRDNVAMGSTIVPCFLGYAVAVSLRAAGRRTGAERRKLEAQAQRLMKPLHKWAQCAPARAGYLMRWADAEWAGHHGSAGEAMDMFQVALQSARAQRLHMDSAMICERFAAFYTARQQAEVAHLF